MEAVEKIQTTWDEHQDLMKTEGRVFKEPQFSKLVQAIINYWPDVYGYIKQLEKFKEAVETELISFEEVSE